jgi:predicted CoA-binding protein
MLAATELLRAARSILLVDWPSRDVPETLVRAGYTVFVKGGPEPDNYRVHELRDGEIADRRIGAPPEHADLLYTHRPIDEMPGIVALAEQVGAATVWHQSGVDSAGEKDPHGVWLAEADLREASTVVGAAGLVFVHSPYIADAVRRLAE